MSYCRYCGTEINYTQTTNDKWMPYDVTGNPHFCQEGKNKKTSKDTGLKVCQSCGKPYFLMGRKKIDYATLAPHECRKSDITRYQKYLEKTKNERAKTSNRRSKK